MSEETAKIGENSTKGHTPTHAHEWMAPFLASLSLKANVTTAAMDAGITRRYAYRCREEHPEFATAWDEAIAEGVERLEAEAWRRAYDGYERPVFQGGEEVGRVREYSDTLMQTLLKAHAPLKYRERISQELTGKDGGPIETYDHTIAGRAKGITELLNAARARKSGETDGSETEPA